VWLAFLPRAQEVKIVYVNPEAEEFDNSFCYVCHFMQQRQYYNRRNYFFLHHCKINFRLVIRRRLQLKVTLKVIS